MMTIKSALFLLSFLLLTVLAYSIAVNFNEMNDIDAPTSTAVETTEPCDTFSTEIIKRSYNRTNELPKDRAINQVSVLIRNKELKKIENLAKYSEQNGYQVELKKNHILEAKAVHLITIKMKKPKIELDDVINFVENIQEEKKKLEIDGCLLALDFKVNLVAE